MTLFLMAEIKFYFELILPISIYPLEQYVLHLPLCAALK